MADPRFKIGETVEKFTGDYQWTGVVCSVFWTPHDKLRYVVAHPITKGGGWVLHIYGENNLRAVA